MASESKKILLQMAANLGSTILNFKPIDTQLKLGELCYVPDRFVRKQGSTIMRGLGKVVAISGNNYSILMSNKRIITRQISQIVSSHYSYSENIDIFTHTLHDPSQINSMYYSEFNPYANITNFNDTTEADELINDDDSDDDDVNVDVESNVPGNDTSTALCSSPRLHTHGDSFASSSASPLVTNAVRQPVGAPQRRH